MSATPLLMVPGPIEVSPAVLAATSIAPPSHVSAAFIERFGSALGRMRAVWGADAAHQPMVLAGSGTLAMEQAIANVVDPGDAVVVVNTGYFSDRIAEIVTRRGGRARSVRAEPGAAIGADALRAELQAGPPPSVVCLTHVDTSTGVRVDVPSLAAAAKEAGALVVVDGVCATGGERLDMAAWGVDVALTASQKAIGLPVGLALSVVSPAAWRARERLRMPPALYLDWMVWQPIFEAYEAGRPSYFATPATTLIPALDVALGELLDADDGASRGMEAVFTRHERMGAAMRAGWAALGLDLLPEAGAEANTLSAIRLPEGVGPDLPARIGKRGVIVAGGLHPSIRHTYFRVGHMGWVTTQPELLLRTVEAVGAGLTDAGHPVDVGFAAIAVEAALDG